MYGSNVVVRYDYLNNFQTQIAGGYEVYAYMEITKMCKTII